MSGNIVAIDAYNTLEYEPKHGFDGDESITL